MYSLILPRFHRGVFVFSIIVIAALRCSAADARQPTLRGAEAVMAEWSSPSPSPTHSAFEAESRHRGSSRFREELAAFRRDVASFSDAKAAQTWLDLVDTFFRRSSASTLTFLMREPEDLPRFDAVLAALPPTRAWDELIARIKERPIDATSPSIKELVLKLLAARLANNEGEQTKAMSQLRAALSTSQTNRTAHAFEEFLRAENKGPQAELDYFTRTIESYKPDPESAHTSYVAPLDSPDLVNLVGEEKAKALIEKALLSSIPVINFNKGEKTRQLASACAVENISRMTIPRWNLTRRIGSPALFEALEKRFGPPKKKATGGPLVTEDDDFPSSGFSEYKDGYGYHILNLVMAERSPEAARRALDPGAPQSEQLLKSGAELLANRGHAEELADFLRAVLSQRPQLNWWETYVVIAARAGRSSEALDVLRAALIQPSLSASEKQSIGQHLADALLADDQVDAGVTELLRSIDDSVPLATLDQPHQASRKTAASSLLKLGIALSQSAWIDTAASHLVTFAAVGDRSWEKKSIAQDLMKAKHYREAEIMLAEAIKIELREQSSGQGRRGPTNLTDLLIGLIDLYQTAGYNSDVLLLLDRAPYWGVADLSDIQSFSNREILYSSTAKALIETGSIARAVPIVRSLIQTEPGLDQGYQLWFKTSPENLEKQLDVLAAEDPFEERPLIWKGEFLRSKGRFDEAEKACRAAIAIDPSDGEQPAGDRLRAYAVLAEVRAAQGDAKQAATYRNVVRAIRLAERADELFHAGLLTQAIALYGQALSLFSDAYCIQSRLAIRLAEAGRMAEAEEHYRHAYELMPDSFGRVESHCFGCEHAFGPENAQKIAERVFVQFVEKNPAKPQVHYLLGFLRSEQDRAKEAYTHYREAARLDPDYLNAWKKISDLSDQVELTPSERDLPIENILRLDPRGKHSSPSTDSVRDLKIIFQQADAVAANLVKSASVYPLKASAEALAKIKDEEPPYFSESSLGLTRENIARMHPFFELITTVVDQAGAPRDY